MSTPSPMSRLKFVSDETDRRNREALAAHGLSESSLEQIVAAMDIAIAGRKTEKVLVDISS